MINSTKMIKALVLSASLSFISSYAVNAPVSPAAQAPAPVNVEKMKVYVNGKVISDEKVKKSIERFKEASPMAAQQLSNPQFYTEVLKSVGMQEAILQEGSKQGLDKTPEYLAKLEEVKPMLFAQIMQDKSTSKITDEQLMLKYNQLKKESENTKQYKVAHILVKNLNEANEIETKLASGANFSDLAKSKSLDTGTKKNGGDLGWSDGKNFVPEFNAAVMKLTKGTYTKTPVKTTFGYHIIKLVDSKVGSGNKFPEFSKVKDQLLQQQKMEANREFFTNLEKQFNIVVK